MKMTKRIMSILLACLMLVSMLSVGVFAAGTQADPIDAATKWFGYGVNTYLLNPSIAEGSEGMWYTLTAEQEGILVLEHSYKNVDYTITITVNGIDYVGGCVDGTPYNRPIMTLPLQVDDVATVAIVTKDNAAGTVYASMNIIPGDANNSVKVKSKGIDVYVAAGQTVYFQDDSLQASYATKGLLVAGDVANTVFYNVVTNAESGTVSKTPFSDTDADGIIEVTLGGSVGGAGMPAVKPAWAIENNSAEDQMYTLTVVDAAGEDANVCQHVYDHDFDASCNLCDEDREALDLPLNIAGTSISEDVDGLAWMVETTVDGLTMDKRHAADYTNATVGGYKLVRMGAVVSNNYAELGYVAKLEDVDGRSVLDIQAKYLYEIDEDNGTTTYAIRITDIPDQYKDREIDILTYIIFEDEAGVQHTMYCNSAYASYNQFA